MTTNEAEVSGEPSNEGVQDRVRDNPLYGKAGERQCKACHSFEPTAYVRFRANLGRIFKVYLSKIEGRYCYGCGDKWFRRMAAKTLIQGWWSPMSLGLAPWFLIQNAREHVRLCAETGVKPSVVSLLVRGAVLLPVLVIAIVITLLVAFK